MIFCFQGIGEKHCLHHLLSAPGPSWRRQFHNPQCGDPKRKAQHGEDPKRRGG
jgi:hypothetical protein